MQADGTMLLQVASLIFEANEIRYSFPFGKIDVN
jgi:hypothetical protein